MNYCPSSANINLTLASRSRRTHGVHKVIGADFDIPLYKYLLPDWNNISRPAGCLQKNVWNHISKKNCKCPTSSNPSVDAGRFIREHKNSSQMFSPFVFLRQLKVPITTQWLKWTVSYYSRRSTGKLCTLNFIHTTSEQSVLHEHLPIHWCTFWSSFNVCITIKSDVDLSWFCWPFLCHKTDISIW